MISVRLESFLNDLCCSGSQRLVKLCPVRPNARFHRFSYLSYVEHPHLFEVFHCVQRGVFCLILFRLWESYRCQAERLIQGNSLVHEISSSWSRSPPPRAATPPTPCVSNRLRGLSGLCMWLLSPHASLWHIPLARFVPTPTVSRTTSWTSGAFGGSAAFPYSLLGLSSAQLSSWQLLPRRWLRSSPPSRRPFSSGAISRSVIDASSAFLALSCLARAEYGFAPAGAFGMIFCTSFVVFVYGLTRPGVTSLTHRVLVVHNVCQILVRDRDRFRWWVLYRRWCPTPTSRRATAIVPVSTSALFAFLSAISTVPSGIATALRLRLQLPRFLQIFLRVTSN